MELGEGGEDLSLTQQLDNMLEEAKIGPELLESLGAGMRGLSESVTKIGDIADASVASKEFTDNISKATTSVDQLSQTYQRASDSVSSSVDQLAGAYSRASKHSNL